MIIENITSYVVRGVVKNNKLTFKNITNVDLFFNSIIEDAKIYAENRNGKIYVDRKINSLYVSYLDCPDCPVIDRTYLVVKP